MTFPAAAVRERLTRLALRCFAVLPPSVRRAAVRAGTPSYTLGAVAVLRHGDEILMLRQRHRPGWSLPGGLLGRGEGALEALQREISEELAEPLPGIRNLPADPTLTLVEHRVRRVDLVWVIQSGSRSPVAVRGAEAIEADWRPLEETDVDPATQSVLAAVRRS